MNRETSAFDSSDTLVVVDRSRRRRTMLPIALSLAGDSSWRAPMGITVIGGLIFSTVLTLVLVPAFFSIAIDVEQWFGKKFHRMVGQGAHATHPGHSPQPAE